MKVGSTPATQTGAVGGAGKPVAEGFSALLQGGAVITRAPASAAGAAGGVAGVSGLLALQGLGGPEGRDRALRKGRRLLDALDRLQLALLGEGPTRGHLNALRGALAEERGPSGDADLDDTLNWAEVRAAVEAAKLERAVQGG